MRISGHGLSVLAGTTMGLIVAAQTWGQALAPKPSGEAVYKQRCAGCHEQTNPRVPPRTALNQLPVERILRALDFGAMMTVAYPMSRDERQAVAAYLGTSVPAIAYPPNAYCSDRRAVVSDRPKSSWNGWSPGSNNARYQSAEAAGLSIDQVRGLKLKWAFGFDGDVTAFSQPTVIDGQIFVGSAGGVIHALRADTGCLQWTFQANGPVRSSVLSVPDGNRHSLLFGDQTGWFYALDAETGALLWKKKIDEHDAARLTGAPIAYKGNVFVPVASWEETRSLDPSYPCCTFRGSIVALRIRDGQQVWKSYLVPEPKRTGQTKLGTPQYGPSGAGVWASPTLDAKRGVMYIATGDNYSSPSTSLSDAIVALEITDRPRGVVQADIATRRVQLVLRYRQAELPGGKWAGLRFRLVGDFDPTSRRPGHPAGRTEIGHGLRVRSRKEGRDCLAGAHRESWSQRGH